MPSDIDPFDQVVARVQALAQEKARHQREIGEWANVLINVWGIKLHTIAQLASLKLRAINLKDIEVDRRLAGGLDSKITIKTGTQGAHFKDQEIEFSPLVISLQDDGTVQFYATGGSLPNFPKTLHIQQEDVDSHLTAILAEYVEQSSIKMMARK